MALLELTVSAKVEAYMSIIPVYNESGSRLENSGGEQCIITEMLRENSKTEYEQVCNSTLAAFSLLILNVMKTLNNSVGPYTCRMNEFKLRSFFLKRICLGFFVRALWKYKGRSQLFFSFTCSLIKQTTYV